MSAITAQLAKSLSPGGGTIGVGTVMRDNAYSFLQNGVRRIPVNQTALPNTIDYCSLQSFAVSAITRFFARICLTLTPLGYPISSIPVVQFRRHQLV
jgi:hypothetical protein